MTKIVSSYKKLYIAQSKILNADRGVFAGDYVEKGEVIERCPIIEIQEPDSANLEASILIEYFYFFGKKKERVLLALGFGSLYNHTFTPNATYTIHAKERIIAFTALKNIQIGEEITVNYNQAHPNSAPLWFEE